MNLINNIINKRKEHLLKVNIELYGDNCKYVMDYNRQKYIESNRNKY